MNVMMMIKMPVACLLLLLYSFYFYRKAKKLQTYPTRIFEAMLYCTFVHLVAEAVTEYTVNNRNMVSEAWNEGWHIVFLLSVLAICFLLYYYMLAYVERGIGYLKHVERRITLVAGIVVALLILVVPITYVDTEYGSYSQGPKAYALYAGVAYVLVMILYNLARYWKLVDKSRRQAILMSVALFVVFSLLQIAVPYVLTTGLAISMVVMGLMLTAEDYNQYLDETRRFFNEYGVVEMLREYCFAGKSFEVPVYLYVGDSTQVECAIQAAAACMEEQYGYAGAVMGGNMIVFLQNGLRRRRGFIGEMPSFVLEDGAVKEFSMMLSGDGDSSREELLTRLHWFKEKHEETVLYRDAMSGVFNRNAYERDVRLFLAEKRPMWYILADLNRLKHVNDTFGHRVGDELIRSAALLLEKTFEGTGQVYRVGGDEFVVLYTGNEIEAMISRLEEARLEANRMREIPMSYAIGYAQYNPGNPEWEAVVRRADFNMYEQKLRSSGRRR